MTAQDGGSTPGAAKRPGWFARLPLWVRIAAPIILVVVLAVIVGAVLVGSAARSTDPADAADAACRAAAEAQLERRGHSDIEVSRSFTDTPQSDGASRLQGTVTFVDDGATHHADVRCIVRFTGDTADVVSVRFND